jgi:hypothetical protein
VTTTTTTTPNIDAAQHRKLAVELFNHVWTLLDAPQRTATQDTEMMHAAHASRHYWGVVGQPLNFAIGEWQLARVYSVLKRAEPSLYHARLALKWAQEHDLGPFQVGCGYEALARASAVAGDRAESERCLSAARECLARITDAEDANILRDDLATVM